MTLVQDMLQVKFLAVLIAAVVLMVLGFIWYTVFAKQWSAYTGWTREKVQQQPQSQMMMSYGLTFVSAFVQAWVLAGLFNVIGITSATGVPILTALGLAALVWAGFVAAPSVSNFAFEHRPWGLWAIINGLYLVNLLVAGIILVILK